jgi:hypothetical protein
MADQGFAAVERRIRAHQGEPFFTRSGLPMTYTVDGDRIKVDRAQPWLSMAGAEEIWELGPDASLTDIDQRITGRAYLFAILRDPRIAEPLEAVGPRADDRRTGMPAGRSRWG